LYTSVTLTPYQTAIYNVVSTVMYTDTVRLKLFISSQTVQLHSIKATNLKNAEQPLETAARRFYPRDAMLARVIAIATCLSVRPSVRPSRAGIVSKRRKVAA